MVPTWPGGPGPGQVGPGRSHVLFVLFEIPFAPRGRPPLLGYRSNKWVKIGGQVGRKNDPTSGANRVLRPWSTLEHATLQLAAQPHH